MGLIILSMVWLVTIFIFSFFLICVLEVLNLWHFCQAIVKANPKPPPHERPGSDPGCPYHIGPAARLYNRSSHHQRLGPGRILAILYPYIQYPFYNH